MLLTTVCSQFWFGVTIVGRKLSTFEKYRMVENWEKMLTWIIADMKRVSWSQSQESGYKRVICSHFTLKLHYITIKCSEMGKMSLAIFNLKLVQIFRVGRYSKNVGGC